MRGGGGVVNIWWMLNIMKIEKIPTSPEWYYWFWSMVTNHLIVDFFYNCKSDSIERMFVCYANVFNTTCDCSQLWPKLNVYLNKSIVNPITYGMYITKKKILIECILLDHTYKIEWKWTNCGLYAYSRHFASIPNDIHISISP